jgi:hypothetical protein
MPIPVATRSEVQVLLCPRGKNPDTHWIGGWVGPRAGLETA